MNLRFLLLLSGFFIFSGLSAQNLSGQWNGGFVSTGDIWGNEIEYVLELEVKGSKVGGYSYSYFIINGKRHYVICRLDGTYDKNSKSLTVHEIEKVKSNTPPDFRDLFQTHMLTYLKQGNKETLQGKWKPAFSKEISQSGETLLERTALVRVTPVKPNTPIVKQNNADKKTNPATTKPPAGTVNKTGTTAKTAPPPVKKPVTTTRSTPPQDNKKTSVANSKPTTPVPSKGTREIAGNSKVPGNPASVEKPQTRIANPGAPAVISGTHNSKLEKRTKQLIKLIEVPEAEFKVDLYDNGQVDGDTISLFFNGKLMVSSKRLSTSPISIKIKLDPVVAENELVMYAENLGSIPPNTALMVVTVGDKRYEVNITSTEQTNGTVRFKLKE